MHCRASRIARPVQSQNGVRIFFLRCVSLLSQGCPCCSCFFQYYTQNSPLLMHYPTMFFSCALVFTRMRLYCTTKKIKNKPPPPGFHAWPGYRRNKPHRFCFLHWPLNNAWCKQTSNAFARNVHCLATQTQVAVLHKNSHFQYLHSSAVSHNISMSSQKSETHLITTKGTSGETTPEVENLHLHALTHIPFTHTCTHTHMHTHACTSIPSTHPQNFVCLLHR